MQHINVKSVFDTECSHLKFDKKLGVLIARYVLDFINKNSDHMTFFGGNLTGVQIVRFKEEDRNRWFTDILGTDELLLEDLLYKLPEIVKERHTTSDVFNISVMWVIHRFMVSPLLNSDDKHDAMINASLALQMKYLTSLLFNYIKYPIDREVAEATYAAFTMKYALKKYGSWLATLTARSEDMIAKDSIHYNTFFKFNDDKKITYAISDSQGRIRDMLKNIMALFKQVHAQGERIITTSDIVEHDGENVLKDKQNNLIRYNRYLHTTITDKNSFIKDELMEVVGKAMPTMPTKLLYQVLNWCSDNYRRSGADEVEKLIDITITHSFNYLIDHRSILKSNVNLPEFVARLRGVYMSSRSTDDDLLLMRQYGETIVRASASTKNPTIIASIRTGLLLYIVLRGFTMHHYTQKGV